MKVYLNKNDLESIVKNYKLQNNQFQFKTLIGNETKKRCKFYINGLECEADFFLKKDGTINALPVGTKNLDECNMLIDYVISKGLDAEIETKQFTFNFNQESLGSLIDTINYQYSNVIKIENNNNIYKFVGYNGDWVNLIYYPTKNKAMIQGKALYAYSIIINIIVDFDEITINDIISINNNFVNLNTPFDTIRTEMKGMLLNSYKYLDSALLKSISGSLSMLKSNSPCEDYTGHVAGMFKGLEGYLKKVLDQKYGLKFSKDAKFSMFHKDKNGQSDIDKDSSIPTDAKKELNNLYSIYKNKRNIILHAKIDPSQTRIIETMQEAKDLAKEILDAIEISYNVFF